MLMVSPSADRQMIEARIDSGIEMVMISVLRQLPRNSRIMSPVRAAAITASRTTPPIAARTKIDWSPTSVDLEALRQLRRGSAAGARLMLLDDVERRGAAGLEHAHQHGALAVEAHDVGLRRVAVAHVRDVAHVDDGAVAGRDRQVVELVDRLGAGVERDEVLAVADLLRAGRQDQVLRADGIGDVVAGQALGAQRVRVEVDLDLALLAAVRVGHGGARHGGEPGAHDVVAEVEDLRLGQRSLESASCRIGTIEAL